MNKDNSEILPPDQFQIEKPPCIRAALMEHATFQIHKEFGERINEILDDFCRTAKVDRPTAFILAHDQLNRKLNPYREMAQRIMEPFRIKLDMAMKLEKKGQIEAAAILYEELADAGFVASMPYDRLRIIYTKQKRLQKAIDACSSFISTLKVLDSFDANPRYTKQIKEFSEHINKLKQKMGTVIIGRVLD
jgi:hypothetical protein